MKGIGLQWINFFYCLIAAKRQDVLLLKFFEWDSHKKKKESERQ